MPHMTTVNTALPRHSGVAFRPLVAKVTLNDPLGTQACRLDDTMNMS